MSTIAPPTLHHEPSAEALPAHSDAVELPFNLESGFRGVDVTQPIFSEAGLRAPLFDLTCRGTQRKQAPTHDDPRRCFDVPNFLDFVWMSDDKSFTVVGETKASFQQNLTSQVTEGLSVAAFGMEFSETFHEEESHERFEETFHKYAAHYRRQQIYYVRLKGAAARYLSDEAADDFETLPAEEIVDKYGTHYMATAVFGGLKVFSSRLDVRDEIEQSKVKTALQMKVKATDPDSGASGSASVETSNSDEQIRKLHQMMNIEVGRVIGGEDGAAWRQSLNVNPALIGYHLEPVSSLAAIGKKAEIDRVIEERLRAQQVTTNASLIGVMVDVVPYTTDRGSGANWNLTVGRPGYVKDWFYFGQWGLRTGDSGVAFPGGAKTLIVRNAPGLAKPAVVEAQGFNRHWGKSSSWGLFSAQAPVGYTACGDLYESTDNAHSVGWRNFYGCVRDDLLEDAPWVDTLWGDWGSGANDDGAAFSFDNNDPRMITLAGDWSNVPRMFKVTYGYNRPGATPKRPRLDCIQVLSNNWL